MKSYNFTQATLRPLGNLITALAVVTVAGCGSYEEEFSQSRYAAEMQSMMDVCMTMQKNGDLPGIAGGENRSLEFSTEQIDFSKKDEVGYPLQIKCMVSGDGQAQTFTFSRQTADADWMLAP